MPVPRLSPERRPAAPVAVAVVSWNTRDLLASCLASLEPDVEAGRAEVWVVDNASSDGSADLVRERFAWAELVEPGRNLGFGAAVDLVARRTPAPWVAAANADVELRPGALAALLAAGEADGSIGLVAPRLRLPDGSDQASLFDFPGPGLTLAAHLYLKRARPDRRDPAVSCDVDWAAGAFLLLRRAAYLEVGGFDPEQWMYAEDLDIAWRLARAGWRRRYEAAAVVAHHESAATTQAFGAERAPYWMAASYAWMVRREGRARTWATAAIGTVAMSLELALFTVLGALRPRRWAGRRDRARVWRAIHRDGLRSRARLIARAPAP